jgi:hypothetical protein
MYFTITIFLQQKISHGPKEIIVRNPDSNNLSRFNSHFLQEINVELSFEH